MYRRGILSPVDKVSSDNAIRLLLTEDLMSGPDREIRLRLSVQRALLGAVSSTRSLRMAANRGTVNHMLPVVGRWSDLERK